MGLPLALLLVAGLFAAPQNQNTVPANGVYSAAQAERGRTIVQNHCGSCHADDLSGLEGPALVGDSFMLKWEPRDLATLFTRIRDTMPAEAVTSLTDQEKLDALAYMLQQNGFTDGPAELPLDVAALARIRMSRQTGPITLRTGSFVRITGCLSQGNGKAWMLTGATLPEGVSVSDRTVGLLNVFPDPSKHKGHKMAASGLLIRDATGTSVNVLSLEMIASSCAE